MDWRASSFIKYSNWLVVRYVQSETLGHFAIVCKRWSVGSYIAARAIRHALAERFVSYRTEALQFSSTRLYMYILFRLSSRTQQSSSCIVAVRRQTVKVAGGKEENQKSAIS